LGEVHRQGQPAGAQARPIVAGFNPPKREELGDLDQAEWETGLSGKPTDPWQFQLLLPLQHVQTNELFVFQTTSITGRRAVDRLIQGCERMMRIEPNEYPVIKLRISGFQHRDDRVGWVKVPAFERIGKAPKTDVTMAVTTVAKDLDDEIPF
jgi:hypothetical protein